MWPHILACTVTFSDFPINSAVDSTLVCVECTHVRDLCFDVLSFLYHPHLFEPIISLIKVIFIGDKRSCRESSSRPDLSCSRVVRATSYSDLFAEYFLTLPEGWNSFPTDRPLRFLLPSAPLDSGTTSRPTRVHPLWAMIVVTPRLSNLKHKISFDLIVRIKHGLNNMVRPPQTWTSRTPF